MSILPVAQSCSAKPASGTPRNSALQATEIQPSKGLFDIGMGEIWRYRDLLLRLTKRDIQILYKQAALGAGWAIIQPIFAVAIFSLVFGRFAKVPSGGVPYPLFAFAGVLLWTYFAEAVRRSATGMVSDAELIRKVYFPRIVMPLSGVIAPLLDFALGFAVLVCLMIWYGTVPGWQLVFVPPLVLMTSLLALCTGLWLGPINVRFRDVKYTLAFLIQVWMYASPVVYPLSLVPENYRWVFSLNPMVGVIEGFRWAVLGTEMPGFHSLVISFIITAIPLFWGLVFFKHMERIFADTI